MIPHTTPARWPQELPPSRLAAHWHAVPAGCRVAVLGLPDDLGVRLNGGRPGAAQGPAAIRAALARYGVAVPKGWTYPRIFDAGDVSPAHGADEAALAETHRRVSDAAEALVRLGLFPIALGGGHDLTYAFVRGVMRATAAGGSWSGVYFDAHLDVRDTAGSGMPFRRLVEECGVSSLRVQGLNPFVNAKEHADWFAAHRGTRLDGEPRARDPGAEWNEDDFPPGHVFVSLDLDVLDAAHAPGVSAMNPAGWSPHLAARWVDAAGLHPRVRCFDVMELCPPHDEGGRTARLAAHLLLVFLRAFAGRSS